MKFSADRRRLLEALSIVGAAIAPRVVKPILKNIRMTVDQSGDATLLATDLHVAIRHRIVLDHVEEGGDVLLPATRLIGILRESAAETVDFETDDFVVRISAGRSEFKVMGDQTDLYPNLDTFDLETSLVVPRQDLHLLISKSIFATAKEKSRYAFNGVRLETSGDEARMIATDGRRMAVIMVPIENPDGVEAGHLIPTKGLATIDRVLADGATAVEIGLKNDTILMKAGEIEVSSRLVEGSFPRYQAVIPKDIVLTASFDRNALLTALRQASVLTNEESRAIRVAFGDDKALLTSRAMDVGESRIEMDVELDGTPLEPHFNAEYLIDGLKQMNTDRVVFKMSGTDTPTLVESEENFTYVVMPVSHRTA